MARTSSSTAPVTPSERELLIKSLIEGSRTPSKPLPTFDQVVSTIGDAAAKSLDPLSTIAGAVTGAWGNAKQRYALERDFRAKERAARERKLAEHYADRLARLI